MIGFGAQLMESSDQEIFVSLSSIRRNGSLQETGCSSFSGPVLICILPLSTVAEAARTAQSLLLFCMLVF